MAALWLQFTAARNLKPAMWHIMLALNAMKSTCTYSVWS